MMRRISVFSSFCLKNPHFGELGVNLNFQTLESGLIKVRVMSKTHLVSFLRLEASISHEILE